MIHFDEFHLHEFNSTEILRDFQGKFISIFLNLIE